MSAAAQIDHLVVMAHSLDAGIQWCEATLGVTPPGGGEHVFMGTHNRLMNLSSPAYPRAYLEIIALNPGAQPTRGPGQKRWFDMDDEALRKQIAEHGPQLIHWVAATPELSACHAKWRALGIDRGEIVQASRATPTGTLEWQITIRDDGQRLMDGCLPTLIQWGAQHATDSLPSSGVQIQSLTLEHPDAQPLQRACDAAQISPSQVVIAPGATASIRATLSTPRGPVTLSSRALP